MFKAFSLHKKIYDETKIVLSVGRKLVPDRNQKLKKNKFRIELSLRVRTWGVVVTTTAFEMIWMMSMQTVVYM